jgi:hypothetical protein
MKHVRMYLVVFFILTLFHAVSSGDVNKSGTGQRVGVVYSDKGGILFLSIRDNDILPGTKVIIFTVPGKRVICCAETGGAGSIKPEGDRFALVDGGGTALYPLLLDKEKTVGVDLGFGIIGPPDIYSAKDNKIKLDIDQDGKNDSFRECTSNEGVHLTIWSGIPLESERLWHAYYYLAYETVPSCVEQDYEK